MIVNPTHSLTFGGLALAQNGNDVKHLIDGVNFTLSVSADGTQWGNPEPVVATLLTAMRDGDLVKRVRLGNREPTIKVMVSATSAAGLVAGEKALATRTGKPVEMVWKSTMPGAFPTVFDVQDSRLDFEFDDLGENRYERIYSLTLSALPSPRSAAKVITPAVPSSEAPTVTSIDTCDSTSGWSIVNGMGSNLTPGAGFIQVDATGNGEVSVERAGTVNFTSTGFLMVEWMGGDPTEATLRVWTFNGSTTLGEGVRVRQEVISSAGWIRTYFAVPVASATRIGFYFDAGVSDGSYALKIRQVSRQAAIPNGRQVTRVIDPGGSVPTEGDILIEYPTHGLGQVIVYSGPERAGYAPPLRAWRTAGPTPSSDTSAYSFFANAASPGTRFTVPIGAAPIGETHIWVRMKRASAGTARINWNIYSAQGSPLAGVGVMSGSIDYNFAAANTWYVFCIGRCVTPPTHIGSAGFLLVDIDSGADTTVSLDDAYLFELGEGTLTVADCGTGTAAVSLVANRLRIVAPSLSRPLGGVDAGYAANWSDSHAIWPTRILCEQVSHRFEADGSMVFVASSQAEATISFEHYPRWAHNAGS